MNDPAELGNNCAAFQDNLNQLINNGAFTQCKFCPHAAAEHRHYMHIHIKKPREVDPKTRRELNEARTEEQKLEAAQKASERELRAINARMIKAQDNIRRLVDEYNEVSLSRDFAGHIRSAIQMLEYRKKEMQSKPNTDAELKLIDESIGKLTMKLRVLQQNSSGWGVSDLARGVYSMVVG